MELPYQLTFYLAKVRAQDDPARLQQSQTALEAQVCSEGTIQKPGYQPYKGRWKLEHRKPIVTALALTTGKGQGLPYSIYNKLTCKIPQVSPCSAIQIPGPY